jgi:hypothetical protein
MGKTRSDDSIYEKILIEKMVVEGLTLSEALFFDMIENEVDPEDIYQATDYLEQMFDEDMDKVEYYMLVLTGRVSDSVLIPLDKNPDKDP